MGWGRGTTSFGRSAAATADSAYLFQVVPGVRLLYVSRLTSLVSGGTTVYPRDACDKRLIGGTALELIGDLPCADETDAVPEVPREVPVADVMRLTGLSRGAIEARLQRGTIKARKVGGRWRFDLVDLYERGLVVGATVGATVAELLDRLEAQAEEIGRLRSELDARDPST
jgi:hypothetical protein